MAAEGSAPGNPASRRAFAPGPQVALSPPLPVGRIYAPHPPQVPGPRGRDVRRVAGWRDTGTGDPPPGTGSGSGARPLATPPAGSQRPRTAPNGLARDGRGQPHLPPASLHRPLVGAGDRGGCGDPGWRGGSGGRWCGWSALTPRALPGGWQDLPGGLTTGRAGIRLLNTCLVGQGSGLL